MPGIGIGGEGGSGNSVILGKDQSTSASMYYYSGGKPSVSQFDFDSKTSQTYAIPIKVNMQAPLIVLIGDSIIAGHPSHYSYVENSLTSSLANQIGYQLLDLNTYNIYQNMGYGGQTTTQISARFTTDAINLKPKYVILDGGVNDIAGGIIDKMTYLGNIESMLDLCAIADIKVIVCKIMPWTGGTNEQMIIRDEWNADLETLVNTYSNAICIDFDNYIGVFRVGGAEGNLWNINPLYAAGDVHYNLAGYRKIAETIYSFMYF